MSHHFRPATEAKGSWRSEEAKEVARGFLHKRPFRVSHELHRHPLFKLDALLKLAREVEKRPADFCFDAGNVAVDDKWGHTHMPDMPLTEIVRRVETAGAWIIMKHIEQNPAYAKVLREFADFVWDLAGPEKAKFLTKPEMLVIITSPKRVTPFHFDAEPNFLVQISGTKEAWVCDPMDRTIVTEDEIERYYAVNHNAGTYKPHVDEKAMHFRLEPGQAIHIPTHGGHWVRNGDEISISLSLNFELPAWKYKHIYLANHFVRKLGLKPRAPGVAPLADKAKAFGVGTIATARSVAKNALSSLRLARGK